MSPRTPFRTIPRQTTRGKIVNIRRESNTEVMQSSINRSGQIRIAVALQIYFHEHERFTSWKGSGVTVHAPSILKAREFHADLLNAITGICEKLGLTLQATQKRRY